MKGLDVYSSKILYELDKQSNMPLKALAKKIRRSKQFVLYRIKKLEKEGIITSYNAIVDMSKLGFFSFRIYFKMRQFTKRDVNEFVDFLKREFDYIWAITTMHGMWDIAVFLGIKTIGDLQIFWDTVLLKYNKHIKEYTVSVYAPIFNFNRLFTGAKTSEFQTRVYGEGDLVDVDELDWKLIQFYAPNVRASALEISKTLGVSADTVRKRIKNLENANVIVGYKIGVNLKKLGYTSYRLDFDLLSTTENKRLFEFCRQHEKIYQVNNAIGGANYEIEVLVKDEHELHDLIEDIKDAFADVVEDIRYFSFSTFHQLKYIPD
ncbi:MAG: winged helix-turn-helix transcriptional regulator [Candidatus Woesearchaeota archaeon]|nr:winged helix-turn-helix transcriptional regulator [Candidatus Woesearchaeota archaeon]